MASLTYPDTAAAPRDPRGLLAALLIALAMILGGGGSTAPVSELALELVAAAMLVAWTSAGPGRAFDAPRAAWIVAGLLVALPLVQLIPLPPAVWHALPGRETERAALALVGQADGWRPWSVAPALTLASLLSLGPCLLVLLASASLPRAGRSQAMAMVAAVGVLALLVGAAQMSGADDGPFRFYGSRTGNLEGFQANRNHAADVLLIAMVAFAGAVREWYERRQDARPRATRDTRGLLALVGGVTAVFSIGVVVTTSRMGMGLLPIAWLAIVAIAWPWLRAEFRVDRRTVLVAAVVGAVLVLAAGLFASQNHVLARIAARFTFADEFRPRIWADSLYAARLTFPFGSGMGTFVPVFQAVERLENVDVFITNRAHNDVIELAIEAGAFGLAALLAVVTIVAVRAVRSLRKPPVQSRTQVIFALATLGIIALHSQVDYPLRSMSLQCLAGLAAGLLMRPAARMGDRRAGDRGSMKDTV